MDQISRSFESAQEPMKETDRSLRKQLAELKLQNEQLNIQLDYERNQEGGYEDAEHDEEEEASSEVSFQQTWPLTAPASKKKDEKAPPKGGASNPGSGGPAAAPLGAGTTGASVQDAKKRKEADKLNIPPRPYRRRPSSALGSWRCATKSQVLVEIQMQGLLGSTRLNRPMSKLKTWTTAVNSRPSMQS